MGTLLLSPVAGSFVKVCSGTMVDNSYLFVYCFLKMELTFISTCMNGVLLVCFLQIILVCSRSMTEGKILLIMESNIIYRCQFFLQFHSLLCVLIDWNLSIFDWFENLFGTHLESLFLFLDLFQWKDFLVFFISNL